MTDSAAAVEVEWLSQANFADFYRLHREHVFRALALTLRNQDLAADAVEEAMARAYERWRTVSTYANQEGWVFRVGLNWARSRMRKTRREVMTEAMPEGTSQDIMPDTDLDAALAALTLEARTVVVLRHYLDMTYDQIASALRIPPGTAKSRLHYATEDLRRQLGVET